MKWIFRDQSIRPLSIVRMWRVGTAITIWLGVLELRWCTLRCLILGTSGEGIMKAAKKRNAEEEEEEGEGRGWSKAKCHRFIKEWRHTLPERLGILHGLGKSLGDGLILLVCCVTILNQIRKRWEPCRGQCHDHMQVELARQLWERGKAYSKCFRDRVDKVHYWLHWRDGKKEKTTVSPDFSWWQSWWWYYLFPNNRTRQSLERKMK